MARILIVDDEKSLRRTLGEFLRAEGHEVVEAEDADVAQQRWQEKAFDVVVSDIVLPRLTGVELLRRIHAAAPDVQVILMTGEPTVETASEALRMGAMDYLVKPITKHTIIRVVATAARLKQLHDDRLRLEAENRAYQKELERLVAKRTEALERELTEHRRTEAALRKSEEQYRGIFDESIPAIYLFDNTKRFIHANQAGLDLLGYEREELLRLRIPDVDADPVVVLSAHQELLSGGRLINYEHKLRRKDGAIITVLNNSRPLSDPQGNVVGMLSTLFDITDRKRTEVALRESETEFRAMFEVASIGMAQADPRTGRWLRVNQKMCAITGYAAEELLQRRVPEITHPEDREGDWELFQRVVRGETPEYRLEKRYIRKGGGVVWVNVNMTIIRDAHGQPIRTMATIEDVSERKRLEEMLRQAQKLEAIGQLAGGVAHDFNNILAAILMYLAMLREDAHLPPATREELKELEASAKRGANLTRQLLMFSRRSVLDMRTLDVQALVDNLLKMLRRLIGEQIDLQFECHPALPQVTADAGMLEQVIMNLTVNARDAMPKGGRILISATVESISEAQAKADLNRRPGQYVCLSITDSGCGMDEATLARIFEPFFTTKGAGLGTGLGLATVHGIVGQHQGWVEVQSQIAQGTTFRVLLPVVKDKRTAQATETEASLTSLQGSETILLVEDEAVVRRSVGHILRLLHYRVFEAANGTEAVRLWEQERERIDLLFTDMVMPEGMTGLELAARFQTDKPALKVILSSGYSAEMTAQGRPNLPGITCLPKPCEAVQMGQILRSIFEGDT